jgi:hypothetical protein
MRAKRPTLPGDIINGVGIERVFLAKDVGPYGQCGTLEDWKDSVGTLANDHGFLRFSIATALAGTLLTSVGSRAAAFTFAASRARARRPVCAQPQAYGVRARTASTFALGVQPPTDLRRRLPARTTPFSLLTKSGRQTGAS